MSDGLTERQTHRQTNRHPDVKKIGKRENKRKINNFILLAFILL